MQKPVLITIFTLFTLLAGSLTPLAPLGSGTARAATITIDGVHESAWGDPLATDPLGDMSEPNLDLYRLYVTEDTDNFYIGFDAYASTWGMTYGIYIDTDQVSGSGASTDPWGRAVNAVSANLPEYALYVWHTDGDALGDVQLTTWSGSWSYPTLVSLGGEQGYGAANDWIEYKVPKAALGNPDQIALEVFTTGGDKHAQDSVPSDPNVAYTDPDWGDGTTTLSAFVTFTPAPVTLSLDVSTPQESALFFDADLQLDATVQPATGVTVTVDLNGTALYTPVVGAGGVFTQALTLDEGENTITVQAADGTSTVSVVRHVMVSSDTSLVQPPVQDTIQDQVFYFVLPDRFHNGDAANDMGGMTGISLTHGYDPTNAAFYHGGDLAGLLQKMDYLDNMGITALWLTPVFKNRPVQGSTAGYHGYWVEDFTQLDPHFGTNLQMQQVITEAHSRGMRVFFDIIVNHTADVIQYQEGSYSYRNKDDYPYRDADGNLFDDRDYVGTGTFPPLSSTVSFPYTPVFATITDADIKVPSWLNDPIYYHNRGDSTFQGENSLYGDFYGLDDLFTEHPDVEQGMIDIYTSWVDFGVDGFRVDTTKHVNLEFWQAFVPAILERAEQNGRSDFFLFGEVFSGNEVLLSEYTTRAGFPAVLDFRLQGTVGSYATAGGHASSLQTLFANDDYFIDADSNAYMLPTFIGNHDVGRIGGAVLDRNPGETDAEWLARSELAHGLMYFARGVPIVYYGDEQGFSGSSGFEGAREDMMPSLVAQYNAYDLIGTDDTTADDNFDPTHPLYQALSDYAALYQAHPALRYGAQIHRYGADAPGIYAFSRIERDDQVEYLLAFNNLTTTQTATFASYGADLGFSAVYTSGDPLVPAALTSNAQKQVTVTVPALGFVIYQADAALPASSGAPGIAISSLSDGQELELEYHDLDGNQVLDRIELAATLTGSALAEVSFAVRPSGSPTYTFLGADDNPPYRVFVDASEWISDETPLDFMAVVNDLNGHYRYATVDGVVPHVKQQGAVDYKYAVLHYFRADGDYGDDTTGDYNDYWGLHFWGDGVDDSVEWTTPRPFWGEDDYGRFAWIELSDASQDIGFIVHRGDVKDGTNDNRFFNPNGDGPEIWLRGGDPNVYTSQAEAQGYVTIHYHRPDGNYSGWGLHLWQGATSFTNWGSPHMPDGYDGFGAYYVISDTLYAELSFAAPLNFIIHNGDDKDPGPDQALDPTVSASAWVVSADATVYHQRGAAQRFATLHYRRPAGDYGDYGSTNYADFWGMHAWGAAPDPGWTTPHKPVYTDTFGVVFTVTLSGDPPQQMGYILHRGDAKDPGPDQTLEFGTYGYEVWQLQGADVTYPYILPILKGVRSGGDLSQYQAHWLAESYLAWDVEYDPDYDYTLHYAPEGGITLADGVISGSLEIPLTYDPAGLPAAIRGKFPHLASYATFRIGTAYLAQVPNILRGQLAVSVRDPFNGDLVIDATGLQIPGVLDDLYAYNGALGPVYDGSVPTLRVWAPTAHNVTLHLFDDPLTTTLAVTYPMTLDPDYGVWSVTGDAGWSGKYYLYEVEVYVHSTGQVEHNLVTDPYAVSLAMNSTRSQVVDLSDPALQPAGWESTAKPPLGAPEDISIYELHVRDFSVNDPSVPEAARGTFAAFTYTDTYGIQHLQALASAGLTHLHVLPAFDIATVNEDRSQWQEPDWDVLSTYPPSSTLQQAAVSALRDLDGFNWGYDPLHYNVPEGSYSTSPNGTPRIVEFRQMVQSLNTLGLRVVMDVVYNHTSAHGQSSRSVLDRVVPGYYHRLDENGNVTNSTCCSNTATEHAMMEKLMIDSVVLWARYYKVDGFRFDLMGHHMRSNMLNLRAALDALTLEEDGVDGSQIYLYGEGWNFGEVADNARGVNATQFNMAGTGIGTFSDRLRDAVRGGGPFDSGTSLVSNQGFISGLYYDPNALNSGSQGELDRLLNAADLIRVGLAGNLANYRFVGAAGTVISGSQVSYNGSPAGYTADPQEHIVYISKHDNQTLYDINQYKLPGDIPMAERVRAQNVGLSIVSLSQGVPFFHAGVDMLRSKSLDRDSYNSGDWFNRLDFTYQHNNWGVGLPVEGVNGANWPLIEPLLADPDLMPAHTDILSSVHHLQELLQIRSSSDLFHLQTLEEVQQHLSFYNTGPSQIPGLIVMRLSDPQHLVSNDYPEIVVLFNATDEPVVFSDVDFVGASLALHPVQLASYDPLVRTAGFNALDGSFLLPARTTAVFVAEPAPALSIDKQVTLAHSPARPGDPVTYTVVVRNTGDADAQGVRITDTLPSGVTGAALDETLTVPAGGAVTRTLQATVDAATWGQTITNTAYYAYDAQGGTADAAFTVTSMPDLVVVKTSAYAGAAVWPGTPITYQVSLHNTGGADVTALITDVLGSYYSVVDAVDFTQPVTGTLTRSVLVPAGEEVLLYFVVQVAGLEELPMGQTVLANSLTVADGLHAPIQVHDLASPYVEVHGLYMPLVMRVAQAALAVPAAAHTGRR